MCLNWKRTTGSGHTRGRCPGWNNRSTTEPAWPPPMMERVERCLCGITAARSAGEWFGFATDLILAKLQQGIGDPKGAYKDLHVLRDSQRVMETDVLSGNIGLRTSVAQNRHIVVIDPARLQGLSPDTERRMSTVESLGDEFFDGRLKKFIQEAGVNANRRAAQNLEKCVSTLVDQKQQVVAKVVTTTPGYYSTPCRREDHVHRSSTDRVENYNNHRDTK